MCLIDVFRYNLENILVQFSIHAVEYALLWLLVDLFIVFVFQVEIFLLGVDLAQELVDLETAQTHKCVLVEVQVQIVGLLLQFQERVIFVQLIQHVRYYDVVVVLFDQVQMPEVLYVFDVASQYLFPAHSIQVYGSLHDPVVELFILEHLEAPLLALFILPPLHELVIVPYLNLLLPLFVQR